MTNQRAVTSFFLTKEKYDLQMMRMKPKMNSTTMRSCFFKIFLIACMIYIFCTLSFLKEQSQLIDYANLRSKKVSSPDNYRVRNASCREPSQPRVALLSSYIASDMWKDDPRKELESVLDHIINKQCYSHLWNYDYKERFHVILGFECFHLKFGSNSKTNTNLICLFEIFPHTH